MTFSLNETEAMARKAARGAGYGWGASEDVGKAVRWLCVQGLDGCAALARLLPYTDSHDPAQISPRVDTDPWLADPGPLCPIYAGAAFADRAHLMSNKGQNLGPLRQPLLFAPFVAQVACQKGVTMTLSCGASTIVTNGQRISVADSHPQIWSSAQVSVGGHVSASAPLAKRTSPDMDAWDLLAIFAYRTYAPATEESRAKGAGSGTTDND